MATDTARKKAFDHKIAEQKAQISEYEKDIAMYKKAMESNKKLEQFFYLGVVSRQLRIINLYIDMSNLSERMMKVKSSNFLDSAKGMLTKVFANMAHVVTLAVDVSLNHNRELLDSLKPFNPRHRLNLYKHIKKTIENLIQAYGENTKWKWSFPEYWGKLAITIKNMTDFREIQSIRDPREEFFYDRQELLIIVKESLFSASNEYRNKFEISTKSPNDLIQAIKLLEDLRKIAALTGDTELSRKCKSGIDAYKSRIKKKEKK